MYKKSRRVGLRKIIDWGANKSIYPLHAIFHHQIWSRSNISFVIDDGKQGALILLVLLSPRKKHSQYFHYLHRVLVLFILHYFFFFGLLWLLSNEHLCFQGGGGISSSCSVPLSSSNGFLASFGFFWFLNLYWRFSL